MIKIALWNFEDNGVLGMQSTHLFPSLPGAPWPGVVVPDSVPIYGSTKTKLYTYAKLNC